MGIIQMNGKEKECGPGEKEAKTHRTKKSKAGKQRGMTSIRRKIAVSSGLVVLSASLLIGGVGAAAGYLSTKSSVKDSMVTLAGLAADRVSEELTAYSYVGTETGCIPSLTDENITTEEIKQIIQQRVQAYGFQTGGMVSPSGFDRVSGMDYSGSDWFKAAFKGKTWISEPTDRVLTGSRAIVVAAPIWKYGVRDSVIAGVVYFVPQTSFLDDIMKTISVSKNSAAFILNKEGTILADTETSLLDTSFIKQAKSDASMASAGKFMTAQTSGQTGFGTYQYEGTTQYGSYAPISGTDGWTIGIRAPSGDFMRETYLGIIAIVLLTAAAVLISSIIEAGIAKRIAAPIKACAERFRLLAEGDLTTPVPEVRTKDETRILADATAELVSKLNIIIEDVGRSMGELSKGNYTVRTNCRESYVGGFHPLLMHMRTMCLNMNETIGQISTTADQVSSGAGQVASGAQALSQGATEQASSVEELAATVNEISSQVSNTATGAAQAKTRMNQVGKMVEECDQQVKQMVSAMGDINDSSRQIGNIIKTIEDIAFQTNILALNAAVEAARAGEAGRGFAVVADEVRNLASKSAEASKNTTSLIEAAVTAVGKGSKVADATAETIGAMSEHTRAVSGMVDQIADAAQQEAAAVEQVTKGIEQISAVVQNNSATSEESAAASEELSAQADMMKELVDRFQLADNSDLMAMNRALAEQAKKETAGKRGPASAATAKESVHQTSAQAEPGSAGTGKTPAGERVPVSAGKY